MSLLFRIVSVVTMYLFCNILLTLTVLDGGRGGIVCNKEFNRRIEVIFWGNAFGCWLFEDMNKEQGD